MDPPKTDLKGKDIIVYDDVASSGGTAEIAYKLSEACSPRSMFIALAHLWTAEEISRLSALGSRELITTNSFGTEHVRNSFIELSIVPLLVEQLKKIS